jgi:hypothetical protein
MNNDWDELIQKHVSGIAAAEESQRLAAALKTDDALADLYLRHVGLELALEARAASAEATRELLFSAPIPEPAARFGWLAWRPIAVASAAGIILGMACTTALFGYVLPRAQATSFRVPALVNGGFEKQGGHLPSGFPVKYGTWSGDESDVMERSPVEATRGGRALRFVRAEREPGLPNHGAASCDVYQIVDLRDLRDLRDPKGEAGAGGEATLELSVQFLDARAATGAPVLFLCRLYVFAGSPEALPAEWPLSQKEALASGSGSYKSEGGSPGAWHQVNTKILLPPRAEFAVVHLVAHKPGNTAGQTAGFGEQYADDVQLTLKTQPLLPVRHEHRPALF